MAGSPKCSLIEFNPAGPKSDKGFEINEALLKKGNHWIKN